MTQEYNRPSTPNKVGTQQTVLAAYTGRVACLRALIARGADLSLPHAEKDNGGKNDGWTALMHALNEGELPAAKYITEQYGVDALLYKTPIGWTPSAVAAAKCRLDQLKWVLTSSRG